MVGIVRSHVGVCRIVQCTSESKVKVVLVGIPHKRIAGKRFIERRVNVEQPYDIELDWRKLEIQFLVVAQIQKENYLLETY